MSGGISRPCDHCFTVKRCHLYQRTAEDRRTTDYLCRPCARSLGYLSGGDSTSPTGGKDHGPQSGITTDAHCVESSTVGESGEAYKIRGKASENVGQMSLWAS